MACLTIIAVSSTSHKAKINVGPAVRVEIKTLEAQQQDEIKAILSNAQPCKITIMQNGKPVKDAEVILENFEYSKIRAEFMGTTDSQGMASIATKVSYFSTKGRAQETFPDKIPAGTFRVKVKIDDSQDFSFKIGKELESVTISDKPFEKKFDLKDF